MGKSLIILILILVLSISTRTLALSTGTTGAFSETMDVIDVDDDQDMIHMNEIPEVDEDNEVLEAHFLGNLGAKIIADDFATTRAHFASKAAFIAKEADFIGAKLSGDAGLLGAPLADVEKVKHGVSLGEKLEDDFAAARAHFSSKANFIASKAGSIGAQLSSGTGLAGAPFVKLASAARERFEFLNGAGAGTRTGQVGNLKHGVKTLKHGVKKGLKTVGLGVAQVAAAAGTAGKKVLKHGVKTVKHGVKKVLKGVGTATAVAGKLGLHHGAKKIKAGNKVFIKALKL